VSKNDIYFVLRNTIPYNGNSRDMARTGQPSRERVGAAARSLAILDALAVAGPLGTNELARRVGVSPSTVSRQLGTLAEARLVEHEPATGRYRLGIRLVELAHQVLARLDVRMVARPHLEAMVEAVDETATLSVPSDPDAITVDFVPTRRYVQGATRLGRSSIAHATAAGKVMLAFTGRLPRTPLDGFTDRTITDAGELEAELERVRRRGWADAYEEREPGLNAIAAPVFAGDRELAAVVALQGPIPRFGQSAARKALPLLREHAEAISRELGAPG
jgi:DNA-binding IclR family transcriptional regulator